jgi:hypothetical protein
METNMKTKKNQTFTISIRTKKTMSIAATVAILIIAVPFIWKYNSNIKAASGIFKSSIDATRFVKSMVIKLNVRTMSQDNFEFIGTNLDMVQHTVTKSFEKPVKWRIDKGERIVICDGKNQFLYMPKFEVAYKGPLNAGFVDWFQILLDPVKIFEKELSNLNDPDSKVEITETSEGIQMNISSKAKGNFLNDYLKNKSITQSDNRRDYIFDRITKLLKSLKIYIIENGKETLILETISVDFNVPVDNALFSPNNMRSIVDNKNTQDTLKIKNKFDKQLLQESDKKGVSSDTNSQTHTIIEPVIQTQTVQVQSKDTIQISSSNTNHDNTEIIELPSNYNGRGYIGIGPKQAVEKALTCMVNNDWDCFEKSWVMHLNKFLLLVYKDKYAGLKIIKIEDPFKSGKYPGVFVPSEIKLRSGRIQTINVPVRNDNKEKAWVIDGGL